jgi:hypothetical protein
MLRMLMLTGTLTLVSAHWVTGQEEKKEEEQNLGWSNSADLGLVLTAGNSTNTNFTQREHEIRRAPHQDYR